MINDKEKILEKELDKEMKKEVETFEEDIIKEEKKEECGCDCKGHGEEKSSCCCEKDTEEEIGKLKAEVEDWKQSYLRKQADFQNFTKRKEKEVEELRKFASEKIITKLLDGLDNLERAISASEATKDFDGLVKGVDMILGQLKGIMENEGVEPIKAEGKYDPMYHHAVMVEDNPEFEDDTIILELQKGYTMKGKVIRPAMVKVCKRG
ncbi:MULTISPECIES: nucleotide exchange factor GrpE [Fusobacterium]|jgi:molecular chaperone GrpE|uniref:Protein GrpE n=1 Tax=Fusobacterium varium ATCC 27725 TaxID=469618 RepID=A0ABM6U381_FUSVA|nr:MULTISPECIES: nucleotide exchange factor GrpE [Fusobacterium]AVQ30764.1 nucleotide exchange factor GrpE [Fusobacterium varium ATCC 27725]EES64190.1 co-chaperone GrpE [Fusobacterium varium ATCC 27725]MCD7979281.1 nucleotide exchange factor GrpE [Fusobacterium sp.]MCF0171718.1 nucleotide exchange factor GrpE [Fusobacterium varium]MCF2673427.1 nucleotide exchange factor GrpE [Fusobacterium varium]